VVSALFDINDDGQDHGYQATNGETFRLKLRQPLGVKSVFFQVYREGSDPSLGIAANPPRASSGAPLITLEGSTSGGTAAPSSPAGEVTGEAPDTGAHSYILRCVVDRGQRTLASGRVVQDPSLVHERGLYIAAGEGLRKIVATETNQFGVEGWADPLNALIANGATSGSFLAPGSGAVARSVASRLSDDIYVTDFMTAAEITDAYDETLLYDHAPALQAAIDYAMYRSAGLGKAKGPRVIVPAGVLRIDDTIHLGYGTDFRSVEFIGAGLRQGGEYHVSGCGTAIVAFFNDRPAVAISGGRSTVVRGMSIVQEKAGEHILSVANALNMSHLQPSAWVDPEFPASASSRYAPLAGIAIDPYSGVQPGTHYPDVTYPAFLGVTPQYGKLHSRNVLIEDVEINGFVVGIALQPANSDANGDFVKVRRAQIIFCVWGYSWGNTQARVQAIYDCIFAYCHTALTTVRHGLQIGNPQISVYSCSFEIGIQLLEITNLNYGQGPAFYGCFAEAMYKVGVCGAGDAQRQGMARFSSCEFGFTLWDQLGVPTWVFEWQGAVAQAIFENTWFYMAAARGGYLGFKAAGVSGEIEPGRCFIFNNCHFDGQDVDLDEPYQRAAYNATLRVVVSNGSMDLGGFSAMSGYVKTITGNVLQAAQFYTACQRSSRDLGLNVYAKRIKALGSGRDPGVPVAWGSVNLPGADVVSLTGRILVVDVPGITTASLMHTGGDVGDILVSGDNGVAFLVKSRTGTELTLEAMNGYDDDEELLESLPETCTFYPIHCRRYSLAAVVYGDLTYDSPTITNVTVGTGAFANIPTLFTIGDFLVMDDDVDEVINPQQANLVSYDNTAKTLTLGGNFQVNQVRRRITLWARPALPNV